MPYFRKRGNVWYFTVQITDDNGIQKPLERPGGSTKPEAIKSCREFIQGLDSFGRAFIPEFVTVADFMEEWMTIYVVVNLKPNSIDRYQSIIKEHIIPALGPWKLYKLKGITIQKFINQKKEKYSKQTVHSILAVLKKSLDMAVFPFEYIQKNPCKGVTLPKYLDPPKEAYVFSNEELQIIFHQFDVNHLFYMPIKIAYHMGMRLAECLALQWKNVDMVNRIIHVKSSLYDKNGIPSISSIPKTASSIRDIPMDDKLYQILKAQHALQSERKLSYGKEYAKHNLVCCHDDGSIITSNNMRYFNMFCKKKFGNGSFHSLRHTHATKLLEAGMDLEEVSKRLGHSQIELTAKIYSHIREKRQQKAVELMNKVL